jgi:hypothetical protein
MRQARTGQVSFSASRSDAAGTAAAMQHHSMPAIAAPTCRDARLSLSCKNAPGGAGRRASLPAAAVALPARHARVVSQQVATRPRHRTRRRNEGAICAPVRLRLTCVESGRQARGQDSRGSTHRRCSIRRGISRNACGSGVAGSGVCGRWHANGTAVTEKTRSGLSWARPADHDRCMTAAEFSCSKKPIGSPCQGRAICGRRRSAGAPGAA